MASPSPVSGQLAGLQSPLLGTVHLAELELDRSTIALTLAALVVVPILLSYVRGLLRDDKIPVINSPGLFELSVQKNVEFATKGMEYFRQGKLRFPGRPFKLLTNHGPMTVLPPDRAHEIRNLPTLDFRKAFCDTVPIDVPGGEALHVPEHPKEVLQRICTMHLTKRVDAFTAPLADETKFAVGKNFGDSPNWTEFSLYSSVTDIIARQSSRVFIGTELCRNEEWLDIAKNYTLAATHVFHSMCGYPNWLRKIVYWLRASGKEFRAIWGRGFNLVDEIVVRRHKEKAECAAKGVAAPVYDDAIEWIEQEGGVKPADFQLAISFAAIHTTSDLLAQALLCFAVYPDVVPALRKEIIEVLSTHGWTKTSLSSLKLLDSAIKEAQRIKPLQIVTMQRMILKDTKLEGGVFLRKGERVAVDATALWDPERYENPQKFDPYRFYKLRQQPGNENKLQLVSATADNLAFGYGKYVCPGRFFGANEVKIALCFLLLKYDWKLAEGSSTDPFYLGTDPLISPFTKLQCRRRKEEIDLENIRT